MAADEPVTDRLRDDILSSIYAPGERLVEMSLSQEYGCGRAAIRAALVQLESEGLVDREENKGAVVRRVSLAEAIEITEARSALESMIAARAARNVTDEDARELEAIIDGMREAIANNDANRYSMLNRELHGRVHAAGRHEVANQMVQMLRNRGVHHQYRLAMMPGRQRKSLSQHAAIVKAIVAGDEQGAAAAMQQHLDSVIDVLRAWGDAV